jgi:microcystin-dependent protein
MRTFRLLGISLLALALSLLITSVCFAGPPQLINYQGKLTDTGGNPSPDGYYNAVFSIYDVPTGGTALWTETWDGSNGPVAVSGGTFNVLLGSHTTIPAAFFTDHPAAYLGVKVGTDSEMTPRQRIASVGYSLTSAYGVPKGLIAMWSGATNNIPDGWAICDGTNGTPNLKDRFIVGAGNSYAVAATGGEATHTLTIPEMPVHTHVQNAHNHTQDPHRHNQAQAGVPSGTGNTVADNATTNEWTTASTTATNQAATATNQNTGGGAAHNTLPPYYALAFVMKL